MSLLPLSLHLCLSFRPLCPIYYKPLLGPTSEWNRLTCENLRILATLTATTFVGTNLFSYLLIWEIWCVQKPCKWSVAQLVGRAIASYTRGPEFKSSHRQILFTVNCIQKTKIKDRKAGMLNKTSKDIIYLFLKMDQPRPLFRLFSVFSNKQYIFKTNQCEKMSIQYLAPGFKLATFWILVSSLNH